jgi:diaminopimelate epimerase
MRFQKFQAVGNDFLIVREGDLPPGIRDTGNLSRILCDRHLGPGADGVELLLDRPLHPDADFTTRLFNSDGGETPISGNGTRAVAAYIYFNDLWQKPRLTIETGAGLLAIELKERGRTRFTFETNLGTPRLSSNDVPVALKVPLATVVRETIEVCGEPIEFSACSMGNPHCSIFVEQFEPLDWQLLGSRLETHPAFPDRTNVEFIRVVARDHIEVRFWERGVGPTLSSGTGSAAAVVASIQNERTDRRVRVTTPGGDLWVEWQRGGPVLQTGDVSAVYEGDFFLD